MMKMLVITLLLKIANDKDEPRNKNPDKKD